MDASWFTGAACGLPVLLCLSAFRRATRPDLAEVQVVQLLPRPLWKHVDSRLLTRIWTWSELLAAIALVPIDQMWLRARLAAGALLTVLFVLVVARALALHVACGCFTARRPAEVVDVVRGCLLCFFQIGACVGLSSRTNITGRIDDVIGGCLLALLLPFLPTWIVRITRRSPVSRVSPVLRHASDRAATEGEPLSTVLMRMEAGRQ